MLDIRLIRENPELVKSGAANKNEKCDIDKVLALDGKRRQMKGDVDKLRSERKKTSEEIHKKKKSGENAGDLIAATRKLGDRISAIEDELRTLELELNELLSWIPNLPHESTPVGSDESDNVVVRHWGEIKTPSFKVKPHWEIGEELGILDLEGSTRISGAGFYVLKAEGARLQRALVNYMLDLHTADGFTELSVPYMVTADTMYGTGQLPKLADDMYQLDGSEYYLIPTAEVPLTNLYKQQILNSNLLPLRLVAHTPCFRREAGAAGKDTRGMIRVHQFDKVELVKIVRPEDSYTELESLVLQAEKVLQGLKLPYRVAELATGDLSFAAAKCYDIELWAPGIDKYLEISSVSNFESFQSRRMNCRFRDENKSIQFPHTLNGSGVALARLIPAILENYQREDGSVDIPEVLKQYMSGIERISK